jgi:ABC-type lipoprotein export system ATPase subunit
VLIDGVGLAGMSDDERTDYRARRMGFVFQFYNLLPILSAVENVDLPLLVARVKAKEARRQALAALEMVGLGERRTYRTSCREVCASERRSPGRSSTTPRSSGRTSRPAIWTARTQARSLR